MSVNGIGQGQYPYQRPQEEAHREENRNREEEPIRQPCPLLSRAEKQDEFVNIGIG